MYDPGYDHPQAVIPIGSNPPASRSNHESCDFSSYEHSQQAQPGGIQEEIWLGGGGDEVGYMREIEGQMRRIRGVGGGRESVSAPHAKRAEE